MEKKLTTVTQVWKNLNQKLKKNSSVDGITTNILQKAFEVIGDRFLQLVNISLDYGTFPKHWKKLLLSQ